jgi:hypothetical protein
VKREVIEQSREGDEPTAYNDCRKDRDRGVTDSRNVPALASDRRYARGPSSERADADIDLKRSIDHSEQSERDVGQQQT